MKKDIILAGVGGQGILSIAAIIGSAALKKGMFLKQAEVHGMSQRGGDVSSNLRISTEEIYSDLIPLGKADLIISVEPMEGLRYLPYLSAEGWLITATEPFININNYPAIEQVMQEVKKVKNNVAIDAEAIGKEINARPNMIVLGAAAPYLGFDFESLEQAVRDVFGSKGDDIIQSNLKALKAGYDFAKKQ